MPGLQRDVQCSLFVKHSLAGMRYLPIYFCLLVFCSCAAQFPQRIDLSTKPSVFDGLYRGTTITQDANCVSGGTFQMEVRNAEVILPYSPTVKLKGIIGQDGTAQLSDLNVTALVSIKTDIADVITNNSNCHYKSSMQRLYPAKLGDLAKDHKSRLYFGPLYSKTSCFRLATDMTINLNNDLVVGSWNGGRSTFKGILHSNVIAATRTSASGEVSDISGEVAGRSLRARIQSSLGCIFEGDLSYVGDDRDS